MSAAQKVTQFLTDIQSVSIQNHDIIQAIRVLFLQADSRVTENIKYGGLVFMPTGVSSKLLGGVFVYQKHLSIEFGSGALFDDPDGHLEGKGQYRRHIKIRDREDINNKQVASFIEQALQIHLSS